MHTVDAKEIEIFTKDSSLWWDENGPFRPLHRLNPVRLSFIKDSVCGFFGRDAKSLRAFDGLSVLDIGCGGGLVCEPMARLGAEVTGIDADSNAVTVAQNHAKQSGLEITYKPVSTDQILAAASRECDRFDVVLALEIVEHVADVEHFVAHCFRLCKPGGLVIFSTLNRTPKSFLLGKVAAEYILGLVPKGTHDWKKFLKPSELATSIRQAGGTVLTIEGMVFDPMKGEFKRAGNTDVNYFMTARSTLC